MPSMTGCRKVPESSLNLSQPQLLFEFGVCAARSAGATRELRCLPQAWSRWKRRLRRRWSSALLSRSSWRMASLPSACAVALRVMPVSLAARSSSTPTVAGVLMVVVRSPARTLPRWTDPQPTFADRWQSLWWAAAWVHDALCSSLMPLVLPSHCLSSWRPMEVRRPASPWTTSPASWSTLVVWMFVWDSPSQDGPK